MTKRMNKTPELQCPACGTQFDRMSSHQCANYPSRRFPLPIRAVTTHTKLFELSSQHGFRYECASCAGVYRNDRTPAYTTPDQGDYYCQECAEIINKIEGGTK
jgi:hypothetical protein